jgi:hypothetical protein
MPLEPGCGEELSCTSKKYRHTGLYVVRGILSPVGEGGEGDLFVAREPKYGDKKRH